MRGLGAAHKVKREGRDQVSGRNLKGAVMGQLAWHGDPQRLS